MGKPLSLDIRVRVVALAGEGLSYHETARRLRISAASPVRIMQRKKRPGGVKAAPHGRPRHSKLDAVSDWLKGQVEAQPFTKRKADRVGETAQTGPRRTIRVAVPADAENGLALKQWRAPTEEPGGVSWARKQTIAGVSARSGQAGTDQRSDAAGDRGRFRYGAFDIDAMAQSRAGYQ